MTVGPAGPQLIIIPVIIIIFVFLTQDKVPGVSKFRHTIIIIIVIVIIVNLLLL